MDAKSTTLTEKEKGERALRVRDYQNLKMMSKTKVEVEPSLFAKKKKKQDKLAAKVAANEATTYKDVASKTTVRYDPHFTVSASAIIAKHEPLRGHLPSDNSNNTQRLPGFKHRFGLACDDYEYKQDHYSSKFEKERKHLDKHLRFKPDLFFTDAASNPDKKTLKHLDKAIKGLAYKDVIQACGFTFQAGEERDELGPDWRADGGIPSGKVPPEFYNLMGEFYQNQGSEVAGKLADFLESPFWFWLVTLYKFGSMPKIYYPYIINDIITRYAALLRTQDIGLIGGYTALVAIGASMGATFELGKLKCAVDDRNASDVEWIRKQFAEKGKLYAFTDEELASGLLEHVDPKTGKKSTYRMQAGEDKGFDMFGMLAKLDKILSNGSTKSLITDIIKAVSIGALATTALSSGKFSTFSMEGANALVTYIMNKYTAGDSVYAGLFRAASGVYNIIYNWFTCNNGYTFLEFIAAITKVDTMFDLLKELATEESVWTSLGAERKNAWCTKFEQLRDFSRLMLGCDTGWKDAKRYLNARQIDEFRAKFIILEARHNSDIVTGLRPKPFAIVVSGATAQGKTGFTQDLNEYFFQQVKVPHELMGRLVYVLMDSPSDFWDGYQSGTLGIVLDDVCSLHSKLSEASGGDKMRRIVGLLLNNQRMLANKADLAQKENTAVRPMWVIANTNVPTLNFGELYRHPCIADRRFDMRVHIEVKEEFSTPGGTLCHRRAAADYERRLAIAAETGELTADDFWDYHVYDIETTNTFVEGVNHDSQMPEFAMSTSLKRTHIFKSTGLFYDFLGNRFQNHHKYQAQLLDKLNKEKVYGTRFAAKANAGAQDFVPSPKPGNPEPADLGLGDDDEIQPGSPVNAPRKARVPPKWVDAADIEVDGVKVKKEGFAFEGCKPYVAAAAVAVAGAYVAKRTYSYVTNTTKRIDKLIAEAEKITEMVNERAPQVERILDTANAGIEIGIDAKDATLVYLKNAITCIGAISAFIGVSTMFYKGYKYFNADDIDVAVNGTRQGNAFSGVPIHPNDYGAKYEPPPSVGNSNYLTAQSRACQGPGLFDKAWRANREYVFTAEHTNERGNYSKLAAHGTFVKDKWFVLNHHCMPGMLDGKHDMWGNWTMVIQGAGTNLADVVLTKADFLANAHFYHETRDQVAVYVRKARDFPDITKYMPDIPGDIADNPIPAGLRIAPVGLQCRIANGQYYGPEPTNVEWGPTGYVTKAITTLVDGKESNLASMASVNFISKVGDCGRPFMALRGELGNEHPYLLYGMHMGVNDDDPIQKLIVPWRKQDFDILTIPFQVFAEVPDKTYPVFKDYTLQLAVTADNEPNNPEMVGLWRMIHRCPPMLDKHHMKDETKTWIAGVVSELNGGTFMPTGSARFVGQRVRLKSATFKSKVRKAPLAKILFKKDFSKTPFKTFGSGKVIAELTTKQVGVGVAIACAKAYSQPRNQPWSKQLREDAMMAVKAMLLDVEEDMVNRPDDHVLKQLHPITPEEALNGLSVDDEGVRLKAGEPVNKHTSAGLFWNEKQSPTGAKGKLGYIIRVPGEPDRLHEDMAVALTDLRALMEKGEYKCMVEAVIKDEPMKPSKLAEGRIRFILVMSMECTLLTREYLFTICRIMALNPFFFGTMVGIDSSSIQWEQLHTFLQAGDAKIFDGDFHGFEYVLFEEFSDAIKFYYKEMCRMSGNYETHQLNTTSNLLNNLTNCVVDFFGNVHEFESVNSSGNPLTTQINCSLVNLLVCIVIINELRDLMGEAFTFEIFVEVRKRLIRVASYGDDLLASVILSKKYNIRILDQMIMQRQLAKYGIIFTDAAKNSVLTERFPKNYTFLGRSFSDDHKGRCVAKLEEVRIMKPLEFYTEHDQLTYCQLLTSTLRSVLQETYYYGQAAYDDLKAILVDSVCEMLNMEQQIVIETYFSAGSSGSRVELTYQFFEDWFEEKYHKGAVIDVRYDAVMQQTDNEAEAVYDKIAMAIEAKANLVY